MLIFRKNYIQRTLIKENLKSIIYPNVDFFRLNKYDNKQKSFRYHFDKEGKVLIFKKNFEGKVRKYLAKNAKKIVI